jgi:GT2 family glycosyltransferase
MMHGKRGEPAVSVVMPVLDNLACTRMALESVLANTRALPYEVVVVDNGSSRETREYLEVLAARNACVLLIRNIHNRGFAAATNQGLEAVAGSVIVLLNNDTIVPPGAISRIADRLEDRELGLVGAVTNRCGGPAQIHATYRTYGEMLAFGQGRRGGFADRPPIDVRVAEMFCVAMRRDLLKAVGLLDERFELGMFEDDDYSRRVRAAGYKVALVEDVFVHHFGEASLGQLAAEGRYGELFHANRGRFEEKWGVAWEPHGRRRDPDYVALTHRVAEAVRLAVPEGGTVVVVSRGDDALVEIPGREAWHFPQLDDGMYAGRHPANDEEAITELERLRERGARFFVLPATARWWRDQYPALWRHLSRYRRLVDDPVTAVIFELEPPSPEPEPKMARESA